MQLLLLLLLLLLIIIIIINKIDGLLNTLMYSIIHLCRYICFIDVQKFPDDSQDRSQYVAVMTVCV